MNEAWEERDRPPRLEGRFEFESYRALRDFLDAAAELSEKQGLYPDMGFGRDYVNITIHVDDPEQGVGEVQRAFAKQLDVLAGRDADAA